MALLAGLTLFAESLALMPSSPTTVRQPTSDTVTRVEQPKSATREPQQPRGAAITESSPPWARLAVLHSNSAQPPENILARFEHAFSRRFAVGTAGTAIGT